MTDRAIFFFDGGCRPNPGPMETAVVHRGRAHVRHDLPHGDNSEAEWLALLHAAELAVAEGAADVLFIGDSTLVVHQASGAWPCRTPRLRAHLATFTASVATLPRFRLKQVPRSRNLAGIALAKAAVERDRPPRPIRRT